MNSPHRRIPPGCDDHMAGQGKDLLHVPVPFRIEIINNHQKFSLLPDLFQELVFREKILSFALIHIFIILKIRYTHIKIIADQILQGCLERQVQDMVIWPSIPSDIFPGQSAFSDSSDTVENHWP